MEPIVGIGGALIFVGLCAGVMAEDWFDRHDAWLTAKARGQNRQEFEENYVPAAKDDPREYWPDAVLRWISERRSRA